MPIDIRNEELPGHDPSFRNQQCLGCCNTTIIYLVASITPCYLYIHLCYIDNKVETKSDIVFLLGTLMIRVPFLVLVMKISGAGK